MFEVFYCVNIIPVKLSISLALVRIAEVRLVCTAQLVVQMLTKRSRTESKSFYLRSIWCHGNIHHHESRRGSVLFILCPPSAVSIRGLWIQLKCNTPFIAGFYIIFHCNPVSAAWDTSALENGGNCNPAEYLADIYCESRAKRQQMDSILTSDAWVRCHNCGQYLHRLGHRFYAYTAALERSTKPKYQGFGRGLAGAGLLCLHIRLCPPQIHRQSHSQ